MITKKQLKDIKFLEFGVEENDTYFKITFLPPFMFNISHLSGQLENGVFHLYGNNSYYTTIEELKGILEVVGTVDIWLPFFAKTN